MIERGSMITEKMMEKVRKLAPPGSTVTHGKYFIYVELPFQKRVKEALQKKEEERLAHG